jgi:signal transduction histidine kinase/ActR/RegA family two-component response regulator
MPSTPARPSIGSSKRFGRTARPLLILAALVPFLLFAGFAWYDYDAERDRARDHATETVDALAEHAQKVIETVDLVLARVLDHIDGKDWATLGGSRDIHDFLASLKRELPQLESVFLVSPDGINAASSRAFPLPPISDAGRAYFLTALQGQHGLYVSAPFKGQIAGTYAFTVTRARLDHGRFDGLVGVTVSPAYFQAFYQAIVDHPFASAAALVRDDGALLVRVPETTGRPLMLGPETALMRAARAGKPFGLFFGKSSVDGHYRLAAFRRLEGVPLMVTYSLDRNIYLRDWYTHMLAFGALAALLSAVIVIAGRTILAEAARENDALQRLVAETARRQEAEAALQQAQKMDALGRLTGGVAHDFNNLLTAILGSLELLQKHVAESRPRRLIATARQAAERGAQLTAQMLAFSRKQEVAVRPVDVNATIGAMTDLLRRAIGPTVRIRHKLAEGLGRATADPVQLEIALLNLAMNARDAMPHGGELTIATAPATIGAGGAGIPPLPPGEYVCVTVADTGEGMTEAVRARALEPFFTTKGPGKGTGLGLSSVFGFAALMGGTVTLESAPGQGTAITLLLPSATTAGNAENAAAAPGAAPGAAPDAPSPAQGARILVIDDDETVRTTTCNMLEDMRLQVVAAASGAAALAILAADRRFDLVIVDFAMPDMNGAAFAGHIREAWPDAPLLFVTGYVENDDLRPWTELGIPTLGKPFSQDTLAAALTDALRKRAQPSAQVIQFRAGGH